MYVPLLAELKRRRVIRALVGYGIVAFGALQIIEPVMHGLHWPETVLSYVVVALALGFPVVVALAWIFDLNEGRIQRAPGGDVSGMRLAALVAVIGLVAATPGIVYFFFLRAPAKSPAVPSSVAVLPFVNMSSSKEDEYFSDGITEELINALANVEDLRVASRTSSFAFKGKNVGVRTIVEELHVATVVEGSVRREGNRVRISAQLIDAQAGHHIWSKTYDRDLQNVFALEDELARAIAESVVSKVVGPGRKTLVKPATSNGKAHEAYLKGRYFWNKRNAEGLHKAIAFFQEATELDPGYALAHVGLADSYTMLVPYGRVPRAEVLPQARLAVSKAMALDEAAAEAHASKCYIGYLDYTFDVAERECRRAIELNPSYAPAHYWYAVLLTAQRPSEARLEMERARQLDPASLAINLGVGQLLYMDRDFDGAIAQLKLTLELDPAFAPGHYWLGAAYAQQGRFTAAIPELEKAREAAFEGGWLGYAYARSGRREMALTELSVLQQRRANAGEPRVRSCDLALVNVGLENKDDAFAWLARAIDEGEPCRLVNVTPEWEPLRTDPRYPDILKRMRSNERRQDDGNVR